MYSIGEIISTYRKKKGLLQQDLADELAKEGVKITYKAISNWEKNLAEPSVTIFYKLCKILSITNMYEAYFGVNPADPLSSLNETGKEKALDYIDLLHASGQYEKQLAKIIPFRNIDIFENAVSAGTGNFLVDGFYHHHEFSAVSASFSAFDSPTQISAVHRHPISHLSQTYHISYSVRNTPQ